MVNGMRTALHMRVQYYHRHRDSLPNDSPRMATILIYVSDKDCAHVNEERRCQHAW